MKFQITTDYAIRIIGHLIQNNDQVLTAKDMADKLGITYSYFIKVAARIKRAGYIESIQGPIGGYRIAPKAMDATLYDVIETMEGNIRINRCLGEDGFCSRYHKNSDICPIHKVFETLQDSLIEDLKSRRIAQLWG